MTKSAPITHSDTKRATAGAILDLKKRRRWSNADMGDVMGCGEGTVRHRLDDDDSGHQMTVHELKRITLADGPIVANAIFADIPYSLAPDGADSAVDALAAAGAAARCAAALIDAAPDGIDQGEWRQLLPLLEAEAATIAALLAKARRELAGGRG